MKFAWTTSLAALLLLTLARADADKSKNDLDAWCQALKCDPATEICRRNAQCDDSNEGDPSKCIYCAAKDEASQETVSKTLLASSISQRQLPVASRLLAKSGAARLPTDSRRTSTISTSTVKAAKKTSNEASYDEYYEYDDDETADKSGFGEEDEYLDDYAEPVETVIQGADVIRKLGSCPKSIESVNKCDSEKTAQSDCRFDTDCAGDHKCCEGPCGQRVCRAPITKTVSVCPSSFTCTLNCRLGYRTDANGCLLCECQSCPSMDRCQKSCSSGYLKDLFGCDICECSFQCPPFSCGLQCPKDVGFAKSPDGCPLCQCAAIKSKPTEYTSSCQADVHCPPGFRCLNDARNVPMCQAVSTLDGPPPPTKECPADLPNTCSLRCANGNYLLDAKGCPTCACASDASIQRVGRPPSNCPLRKCAQDCGARGYLPDADGCRTCDCAPAPRTECASAMCRMFCVHGFRRDANGCEICQCNDAPQPCPRVDCQNMCPNGYRKDYSGCSTCSCTVDQSETVIDESKDCSPMTNCEQKCEYGYERDLAGCQLCSCNRCPLQSCRMFCVFGFKKNKDGCDVCECDWTPVSENIQCSERIPCTGSRVCNLDLKLCETVSADRVNWFVYDFDIDTPLFEDPQFVAMFKNGLINNIASKYRLEPAQVTVSGVEARGQTAFQIMPYFRENMDDFQKKMDDIDADLNSQAFSSVLPAVAKNVGRNSWKSSGSAWYRLVQQRPIVTLYVSGILVGIVAALLAVIYAVASRQCNLYPRRSESKSPIFDTPYQPAPTEEEQYHAIHAPDGTAYVVVESEETPAANDKRALV